MLNTAITITSPFDNDKKKKIVNSDKKLICKIIKVR